MKVRHVDWYFDEWIAGTRVLTNPERGVYVDLCTMICSEGGPIARDDATLARFCGLRVDHFARILDRLKALRKVVETDAKLTCNRCETELKRSRNRTEINTNNGSKGGRPRSKPLENNNTQKPNGFNSANPQKVPPRDTLPTGSLPSSPSDNGREENTSPASDRLRAEGAPLDQPAHPQVKQDPPPPGYVDHRGYTAEGDYCPMLPTWIGTQTR